MLAWFDFDGDSKLYHFRFLPAERRAAAAQYIKANDLDAPVSMLYASSSSSTSSSTSSSRGCRSSTSVSQTGKEAAEQLIKQRSIRVYSLALHTVAVSQNDVLCYGSHPHCLAAAAAAPVCSHRHVCMFMCVGV